MATTHELSNLNWYTALVVIQHTTSQGQVNHDFLYSHYLVLETMTAADSEVELEKNILFPG